MHIVYLSLSADTLPTVGRQAFGGAISQFYQAMTSLIMKLKYGCINLHV